MSSLLGEIDLSNIFASFYWGFVITLFLGGITIVQAYIYFPHPEDRLSVRITAAFMLICDLTSSALVAQSVYYYLIPHYGSLDPLHSFTPELSAECLLSTIMTFISQSYFVLQLYSVKRLGKGSWLLIGTIAVSAVLAFLGGVACVATMYIFHTGVLSNRDSTFAVFFGLAKGFGAFTDILATAAMCIFLTSSKTGMNQTNSLLNSLMRLALERGALVTLIQTLLLITFFAAPKHLYWLAFHVNVTKLYANTFFAMLNARDGLKEKHSGMVNPSLSTGSQHAGARDGFRPQNNRISLHTLEAQSLDNKPFVSAMPTVTKTVMIANM